MRYIGVLALVVIVIAIFSNLLYDSILIRYGIILALLVVCFIFRKKIIQIIKDVRTKNEA